MESISEILERGSRSPETIAVDDAWRVTNTVWQGLVRAQVLKSRDTILAEPAIQSVLMSVKPNMEPEGGIVERVISVLGALRQAAKEACLAQRIEAEVDPLEEAFVPLAFGVTRDAGEIRRRFPGEFGTARQGAALLAFDVLDEETTDLVRQVTGCMSHVGGQISDAQVRPAESASMADAVFVSGIAYRNFVASGADSDAEDVAYDLLSDRSAAEDGSDEFVETSLLERCFSHVWERQHLGFGLTLIEWQSPPEVLALRRQPQPLHAVHKQIYRAYARMVCDRIHQLARLAEEAGDDENLCWQAVCCGIAPEAAMRPI